MSTGNSRQASLRAKPPKLSKAERKDLERRNLLVEANLEWARSIAIAVARRLPTWFTVEDLIGPAEIGLVQAASRYNPSKNDNFRAYARARVHGAIIGSARRKEYKERAHLWIEDHCSELPAVTPMPDLQAQKAITGQQMWNRVNELPEQNARVIRAHYWAQMTLVEIAGRIGVSESRVCRLHREGLEMLKRRCVDLKEAA